MVARPHKLRVPDIIASLIRSMHPQLNRKVKAALQSIQTGAAVGKALKDALAGLHSFRINRFRIIYRVKPGQYLEIVAIGPRRSLYEETYRLISREQRGK